MERRLANEARLLSMLDFGSLSAEEQAEALSLAEYEGMNAVERMCSSNRDHRQPYLDVAPPEDGLRQPCRSLYYLEVIGPAAREGRIEESVEDGWRELLSGQPSENEPRVARFLAGWRLRAEEIIQWQWTNGIRR
jgi:hypothetical protein